MLDAQRAQNINIMLAKFGKKSFFDLAQVRRLTEAEMRCCVRGKDHPTSFPVLFWTMLVGMTVLCRGMAVICPCYGVVDVGI